MRKAKLIVSFMAALVLMLGLFSGSAAAQTVTGQISGSVADPTGAVVAGAKVTLTYVLTGQTREVNSGGSGEFAFTELVPGTYALSISQQGFNAYSQKDIVVGASERLSLHQITLAIGNVTTEVSVIANQAHVETDSSDHAGLLTETQYQNVPSRGRNYLDYLRLLPGVTAGDTGTNAPGWSSGAVTFNGGNGQVVMQLDGIVSMDTGQNQATGYISPSVDAIQEVRVQVSNVDAEYGSRAGGTVNVIIKNGTRDFHGSAYEYLRNQFFNANAYFNKIAGSPAAVQAHPSPYKYHNFGGTFGGPVVIPGLGFNKNRDKLFFFFSGDYIKRNDVTIGSPTSPSNMTTPTPAELNGEFLGLSKKLTGPNWNCPAAFGDGTFTCLYTGGAADPAGLAILKLLPSPLPAAIALIPGTSSCRRSFDMNEIGGNTFNSGLASLPLCVTDTSNYHAQIATAHPWDNDILRVDYNVAKNELWYVRLIKNFEQYNFGFLGGSGNWPQLINLYTIHSSGAVSTLVSTIRPNLVNELTIGTNRALQEVAVAPSVLARNQRAPNGLGPSTLPVLFPSGPGGTQGPNVNPKDLIPTISFGGGTNSAGIGDRNNTQPNFALDGSRRFPFFGTDTTYNLVDNISWVKGTHNMKFGIYFEKTSRNTQRASEFHGNLNFAVSSISAGAYLNPLDTGSSLSNAYTGVFQTYTESDFRPVGHGRYHQIEWFGQDNWKATRRLSLDVGVRFQLVAPDTVANPAIAEFFPAGTTIDGGGVGSVYNPALQPGLIRPCLNGSGQRVGCDSTNAFRPAGSIGLFDPTTAGTPYQGMVKYTNGAPINTPAVAIGPRLGFAYDVFGNGKTAIRGAFGIFYDRNQPTDGAAFVYLEGPPLINTPTVYNSTIPSIAGGFIGPANVNGTVRNNQLPVTYQYTFGVQHDLGHGILLDVSLVGNQLRHSARNTNNNVLPYGTNFKPTSADPTAGPTGVLPQDFLRPNPGYGNITYSTYDGSSNYNSLQATATKRFGRRLTLSSAWTYSHQLGYNGLPADYLGVPRRFFYGPNGNDRRNNVKINWTYNLPNGPFQNALAKQVVNGWTVSGIATMISGAPGNINPTNGGGLSGGGGPNRINLVPFQNVYGDGTLTPGQGPLFLRAAAFANPPGGNTNCTAASGYSYLTCGFGTAGPTQYFAPGFDNWDISVAKSFQLGSNEARQLQFRVDTFNTFNHTEFTTVNTSFGTGNFGRLNGTNLPRIVVLSLKFKF